MSHVWHRNTLTTPPTIVGGEGAYLIDPAGRRYLDACGGAAVSCLGHNHPRVVAAVKAQLDRLDYAHTSFFTNEPMEALADHLIAQAPTGLSKAYFVSSGSEAIEAALKLARQYFLEIGQPQRRHFIARRQSYHGNTLGALAVGGNAWRRQMFQPLLMESHHIAPCYAYRDQQADESLDAYGQRVANELDQKILALGAETVAAFIAEPVVGATLGAVPAVPGYFRRIREICDRHGVLLILDEVMCGMGRTGTLHACEAEGIRPDIMTIAKGLGGGVQPIGAFLAAQFLFDAVQRGSGAFLHGHTYVGHPVACAAALAVQQVIADEGLLAQVRERGQQLAAALTDHLGQHPHVGDIRGRGLFQAIELVADRDSKAPFDPADKINARIKAAAMAAGLLCYPMGGTIDGVRGDHVLLAPPYIVTADEVEQMAAILAQAVAAATQQ